MNIENYLVGSRVIHDSLSRVAFTTYVMALSGCANVDNPDFVSIMKTQSELLNKFDRLHEEFIRTNTQFALHL